MRERLIDGMLQITFAVVQRQVGLGGRAGAEVGLGEFQEGVAFEGVDGTWDIVIVSAVAEAEDLAIVNDFAVQHRRGEANATEHERA
jgi:hypothetical protein